MVKKIAILPTMFDPVDPKQSLPDMEEGILQYWKEEDIFKRSVNARKDSEDFSFYDGPPFATGLPHYGNLLPGTIKDVIPRYQTMKGKRVERRFGWDCHGLPVENLVEKENKIKSHKEIEEMGVKKFNKLCCNSVQRYTKEWRDIVERTGRWVDMDWDYRTMDPEYMESIWWAFKELYKKGLVYEGHKPMHICPRCVTPLSNFEVTQGYKDVTDITVTAKFELIEKNQPSTKLRSGKPKTKNQKTYLLAWTTTPWTLPGNFLMAVNKDMDYVVLRTEKGEVVIFGKELYESTKDQHPDQEVIKVIKGKDLIGKKYEPLFPYHSNHYGDTAYKIVEGDFVTAEDGTGIVHIAPFGEEDFKLGTKHKIDMFINVTMEGKFKDEVKDFAGLDVKPIDDPGKTDKKLIDWLKKNGKLFAQETHKHSYPHCWRCDSPLLNYATSSWFIAVEKIKNDLLKANSKTTWIPDHIRDGRFGNWLEGARDWAVSRNRFWGTPIPIWKCEETGEIEVIGSRDELMSHAPQRFTKVTVIRHGESEGNLIPRYQGVLPGTDLTENGKKQIKEASKKFKPEKITRIYCSPFARTKQTAQILAEATGAEIIEDERIREISFGEYEGKTIDFSDLAFVKARRQRKLKTGSPETIYHFPGMETWEETHKRIEDFLEDILPKHKSEHILIVTHADPVRNFQQFFTKEDPLKISHQPYPKVAKSHTYFYDHQSKAQMDLHKHSIDDVEWNGSGDHVEIVLVRHGETDWNAERILQGHQQTSLNKKGKEQIIELAKNLKGEKFDALVVSDLKRATESAEILSKELDIKIDLELPELRERAMGEYEGKKAIDIIPKDKMPKKGQSIALLIKDIIGKKGGETWDQFLDRARKAADMLHKNYKGKRVLVVAHGGILRTFETLYGNGKYKESANAATTTFKIAPSFKRIPEVFDCWVESGSMPYAQPHFPFAPLTSDVLCPTSEVPPGFPADFIAEGIDQTRGWFYTLTVLSTALFGQSPFKNCIVNGTVLAEDGKKMSKRLKNYPDPSLLIDKYGADAFRFALINAPVVRGEDLRFSEKLVAETMRNIMLKLWNSYSFFVTYANASEFEPTDTRKDSKHPLDIWIKAEMQDLANRITEQLDKYEISYACAELDDTIDALTNWYIRLSRKRFAGQDKEALDTLYDVLLSLSQLIAPFCPFMADAIYLNLVPEEHGSVHLTDWPEARSLKKSEKELIERTRVMRLIVSLGHKVRAEKNIKVRQPLSKAVIAIPPAIPKLSKENLALLRQELNVKDLSFADDPKELADVIVKVDARKVGPRLGERVQEIIQAGKNGDFKIEDDGSILIRDEKLTPEEAEVVYLGKEGLDAAAEKGVVVSVNTEVTDNLKSEGLARDLIRTVQRLRKERGLTFTDKIHLKIEGADDVLKSHGKLIEEETRSTFKDNKGKAQKVDLDGKKVTISFSKTST